MASDTATFRTVEMSHGTTRYLEAGEGPDVLLLHGAGFLSGAESWLPVVPLLAPRFHLLAPDALGWGPGGQLEQPYAFAYLVDSIREFQDVVGIERSHVVGHSMGGWLAALLAYESPNRIDHLVLASAGGTATRQLTSMAEWQPPTPDQVRTGLLPLVKDVPEAEELIEQKIALAADPIRTDRFRSVMHAMSLPETRVRYNTRRRLPHISAATLVIWGTNDQTNSMEMGEDTHALVPGSTLVRLEGVGHGLVLEAPDQFADALTEFFGS